MLPDRVLNPGPLTYQSGALPIALCGLAKGQGSRRVKIGPVSKIDEILLYCVCMSSVTENDFC